MATVSAPGKPDLPDATQLAVERTHLAHERTMMAWVRTATALISFGFTIYKFMQYMQQQGGGPLHLGTLTPRRFGLLMIGMGLLALVVLRSNTDATLSCSKHATGRRPPRSPQLSRG